MQPTAPNRSRKESAMNKAARRLDGKWLWLAGFGLLLWACSPTPASQDRHSSTSMEETTVNLAHRIDTDITGLPAIDREAPTDVETAAFGLG